MSQLPADVTIPALPAGTTLVGTELFEAVQTASGVGNSVKLTANQIAAFVGTSVIPLLSAQAANSVLAGPISGAASNPAFRALVTADIPWTSITQDVAISALGTATVTGLQGRPLLPTLPTTSQVLTWNGSAWLPTTLAASGITSLLTGTGLTGGPITGTGTVSLTVPVLVSLGGIGTTTAVPSGVILGGANATAALTGTTVLDVPRGGLGTGAALPGGVVLGGANATAPLTFTAVLGVTNGGIGTATLIPRGVILGGANATAPIGIAPAVNTGGNILIDQGTTANPIFQPMSGDATVSLLGTTTIGANKVTYSKLQQGTGLSVLGVAGTAVANFSAITGALGQVLAAINATTIGFTGAPSLATSVTAPFINLTFGTTALQINGTTILGLVSGSTYVGFFNTDAAQVFLAGNSANDPVNYYSNQTHIIRGALAAGGTAYLTLTNTSATFFTSVNARYTTAIPAGGIIGMSLSSAATFGIYFGSGVPTASAATGSLYLRSDGTGTTTRCYINQNGSTTWTNLVTGA